jgi:thymidylate synthase (FAD)
MIELEPFNPAYYKVLDHGYVRLCESLGDDLSIVRNARVSYDAAWRAGENEGSDTRLINYLMRNNHTTPFESVVFTFDIKAPIFVVRQWHRHRIGWSYNELSGRYKELEELYYVPKAEFIGVQSEDNKQMRTLAEETLSDPKNIRQFIDDHCRDSFRVYKGLIADGCPREIARSVLPLATYTHMFTTVNFKALMHFCTLRLHEHAQWEIRQYAAAMLQLVIPIIPVASRAYLETFKPPIELSVESW